MAERLGRRRAAGGGGARAFAVAARPEHDGSRVGVGYLYGWWADDALPALAPLPGLVCGPADDLAAIARCGGISEAEARARLAAAHVPYLARLDGQPVALGWSAHRQAEIGELGLALALPSGDRYLWDFVTVPAQRGRGLYPRLLQAILRAESPPGARFWIGHDLDNAASGRGILRAGFQRLGLLWRGADGALALEVLARPARARRWARLAGVALLGRGAGEATAPGTLPGMPG